MPKLLLITLGVAFSATLAVAFTLIGIAAAARLPTPQLALGDTGKIIEKRLTRADCLKKPGYVWIEETKRCVKDHRGSY